MAKLTDLEMNQSLAALSGYEIVEGPDPEKCYICTEEDSMRVFDVLDGERDMVHQLIADNSLDVHWHKDAVTVTLPDEIVGMDFISYTDCDGNLARAALLLILNASGMDRGTGRAPPEPGTLH